MYQEKILVCKECGGRFPFTVQEQEFYARKGLQGSPIYCQRCRVLRKERAEDAAQAEARRTNYAPRQLTCMGCRTPFVFTSEDQRQRAALRLLAAPPMCPRCFAAWRKAMGK